MINFCQIKEHTEAYPIQFLLRLNDTVLQWHLNYFNNLSKHISVTEGRNRLEELLIHKIPGAKLIHCQILTFIWRVVPPILLLLGTLGNFLAFFVLCQKPLLRTSSYVYLVAITVIDEIILLTGLLRRWISYLVGNMLEDYSEMSCKISQFLGVAVSLSSVWLIVLMTIERLFIIKMPLHAHRFISPYKAKIYILILLLFLAFMGSHFFETVSLVNLDTMYNRTEFSFDKNHEDSNVLKCYFKEKYLSLVRIWIIIDALFYSIIPFILLIIMNTIIIKETYDAGKSRASMVQHHKITKNFYTRSSRIKASHSHISYETKQLTIMLLAISFAFLCTTTPLVTLKFVLRIIKRSDDLRNLAMLQLIDTIFEFLMYINHSINFLLYCAAGKRFRIQLSKIFKSRFSQSNLYNSNSKLQSITNQKRHRAVSYTLSRLKDLP